MAPEKQQGRASEAEVSAERGNGAIAASKAGRRRRWRRPARQSCHCCGRQFLFCWHCRCGFEICQTCMDDNVWGMSCNHITWQCPDCGELNGFGNQ